MTTENEQAAQLAEQTANALEAARGSLIAAADVTDEVDNILRPSEKDIVELSAQAPRVRQAGNPRPHLLNAEAFAKDVDRRLGHGQAALDDVRNRLNRGTRALNAGRQFLTELEQLPGRQAEATDHLRRRLDRLGRAVGDAGQGVDEAGNRLAAARRNLEPVLYPSRDGVDPGRAAAVIDQTGANVRDDVMAVHRRLEGLRDGFERARPEATAAAKQSAELAKVARAGMNPTPASPRSGPAASSEMDLRRRNGEATQSADRDR